LGTVQNLYHPFLMAYNDKLSKEHIGEILGGFNTIDVLHHFTSLFSFNGQTLDTALRNYLSVFMLPKEAQVIDRIMEVFAEKYVLDNQDGGKFPNKDSAYTMAFSLIILNTDRYSPAIPENKKMTFPQFLKNNTGIWDGQDPPHALQEELFNAIVNNEIVFRRKGDPDKRGWIKGIRANNYYQTRRWLVLIGNELRWYRNPSQGTDRVGLLGKVLLDYVRLDSDKTTFSVLNILPKTFDFLIFNQRGKETKLETLELQFFCENEQQQELWFREVSRKCTFNNPPEFTVNGRSQKLVKMKSKKRMMSTSTNTAAARKM